MKSAKILAVCFLAASWVGCGPEAEYPQETPSPQPAEVQQQLFGDSCNNIDITIRNSRERNGVTTAILVDRVEAWSASEGEWLPEDLVDTAIPYGGGRIWYDEDLARAENDTLTRWRVHYRYKEADGDWSDPVHQDIDTPNVVCHADDNFVLTVQ
jgi:hypothetical protein